MLTELGLDRYPELWPDYFGHYRRVVWLAQHRDPALEAEATAVAAMFGLPLTVIDTGMARLERELENLISPTSHIGHDAHRTFHASSTGGWAFVMNCPHETRERTSGRGRAGEGEAERCVVG